MKKLTLSFLLLFLIQQVHAFKVVGYLPSYRSYALNSIDFSKLTHVMVSFANPNADGVFSFSGNINSIKAKAEEHNCKVFISIGGGGLSTEVEDAYKENTKTESRSEFVHNLISFVKEIDVDGIDVDLEGSMVQMATYDGFVQELIDSAHMNNLEVSAALAKWTGGSIDKETVEKYDFINIMAYDLTGPWTGPGQHSPMSQAQGDFNYWVSRGAKKENLVLGLPFYGWEFKASGTDAKTWCQIVSEHPNNLDNDEVINDQIKLYYNGKNTIREKVQYAKDNFAGGVMIWEIGQDCFNNNSLLTVVDAKVHEVASLENEFETSVKVFPNPTNGIVNVKADGAFDFKIVDLQGKVVLSEKNVNKSSIGLEAIRAGVYFLIIDNNGRTSLTRLVKK